AQRQTDRTFYSVKTDATALADTFGMRRAKIIVVGRGCVRICRKAKSLRRSAATQIKYYICIHIKTAGFAEYSSRIDSERKTACSRINDRIDKCVDNFTILSDTQSQALQSAAAGRR